MTREIKFKFYDKEEKSLVAIADVFDEALYPYLVRRTLVPCQYTGLHDKNGKEIFEGDIMENNSVVCFTKGKFHPVYDGGNAEEEEDPFVGKEREIIGNIYENPELLN